MLGTAAWMLLLGIGATPGEPAPRAPARSRVEWEESTTTVFAPRAGGVWYPRLLRLRDGGILCAYDTNEGGPRTFVQVSSSGDEGRTWGVIGRASHGDGDAANGQLLQAADGGILCAYRLVRGADKALRVARSGDGGRTWEDGREVVADSRGVWEPHLIPGRDGSILMFHASEAHPPQAIVLRRSGDGGQTWGPERVVASHPGSRDGMPVAARGPDGSIVMVFEAQDAGHPFVVRALVSADDGLTWGPRRLVYEPAGAAKRASAPYVVALPTGELMASFQTDEDRDGEGDGRCDMKAVLSSDGGVTWDRPSSPFRGRRGTANWNSLFVLDDRTVLAASSLRRDGDSAVRLRRGRIVPE